MRDAIITVENLGKKYTIGHQLERGRYTALRDVVVQNVGSVWNKTKDLLQGKPVISGDTLEEVWALRDVNFTIGEGEAVGIIGRNGAGKSTLLKILSRITEPSTGRVTLHGRVASLLEVGTGFHPELSGRENIFLNGAILGMSRREIRRKFDEIVAFAEVEKYLDTPVKRYSSGMYVRLAFAVAAHLEPEILLVDEVLAVGDVEFQKKCLGKMDEVAHQGRTVMFVSHNMGAIKALCQRGLYFDQGALAYSGPVDQSIQHYLHGTAEKSDPVIHLQPQMELPIQLTSVAVVGEDGAPSSRLGYDESFCVQIQTQVRTRVSNIYIALHVHDQDMTTLLFSRDFETNESLLGYREPGHYTYDLRIPEQLLVPGEYSLSIHLAQSAPPAVLQRADHVCTFEIVDRGSVRAKMGFPWYGKVAVPLHWQQVDFVPEGRVVVSVH